MIYVLWGRIESRGLRELIVKLGMEPGFGTGMSMIDLTPHDLAYYAIAYGRGRLDGKKDATAGRHILEAYGMGTFTPDAPNFSDNALKEYGIEINHVTGCVVNTWILGHAKGYNDVMIAEIKRRFGPKVVTDAEEADRQWQKDQETARNLGHSDAEKDLREGQLVVEVYGSLTDEADYAKLLREKYRIELRHMTDNTSIENATTLSHADGYNEVSEAEIERRFGEEPRDLLTSMRVGKSYAEAIQARMF